MRPNLPGERATSIYACLPNFVRIALIRSAGVIAEKVDFELTFLEGLKALKQTTLLGIDLTDTLSTADHVNRLLMQVNQRLYLLS